MSEKCVTCHQEKPLLYRVEAGRQCQNCYRREKRQERGLKKPGPQPQPDAPNSRYNPYSGHHTGADRRVPRVETEEVKKRRVQNKRYVLGGLCANGHLLDERNAYVNPGSGQVQCKVCRMNWQRRREGKEPLERDYVGPRNGDRTHCPKGHELVAKPGTSGWRYCRVCAYASRRKTLYGIEAERFDRMLTEQDGCCAICFVEFSSHLRPHVDHDHTTGAIRGLLCTHCNNGLGRFKDDAAALRRAAAYLERQVSP